MNKRLMSAVVIIAIILILVGLFLLFQIIIDSGKDESIIFLADDSGATPENVRMVVESNNKFAFELYDRFKDEPEEENIFFSPYSVSTALAIAYEGASGKTADEIQQVTHLPRDNIVRRSAFARIYNDLNKEDKEYELAISNALWAEKTYKFLDEYNDLILDYYNGKATNLDFKSNPESSRATINNWVSQETNNRIKELIPKDSITSLTLLVITDTIYFKGKWINGFNKNYTRIEDFNLDDKTKAQVQMMNYNKAEDFNYSETDNLQILELPYKGNEISMLILLPISNDITDAENYLTQEKIISLKNSLKKESVEVSIPKFKFETNYMMQDTLKQMGMPTAFSNNADFIGMDGTRILKIDQVIHDAFIKVDEEGTEAAAATAVIMGKGMPEAPKIFKADRPFVFIIQERKTGNILFIGRVLNPNK